MTAKLQREMLSCQDVRTVILKKQSKAEKSAENSDINAKHAVITLPKAMGEPMTK
jgi:hypothetical protein